MDGDNETAIADWVLGGVQIVGRTRDFEAPPITYPLEANFCGQVTLLGYDLDRTQVRAGESFRLSLVWRCLDTMEVAYTVFTHLLDPGDQIQGQKDNPPMKGTYATTLWMPGEIVVDAYEIQVDGDAEPGSHVIEVGMYDPATMLRLPVSDPTGAIGNRVLLASLQVDAPE